MYPKGVYLCFQGFSLKEIHDHIIGGRPIENFILVNEVSFIFAALEFGKLPHNFNLVGEYFKIRGVGFNAVFFYGFDSEKALTLRGLANYYISKTASSDYFLRGVKI